MLDKFAIEMLFWLFVRHLKESAVPEEDVSKHLFEMGDAIKESTVAEKDVWKHLVKMGDVIKDCQYTEEAHQRVLSWLEEVSSGSVTVTEDVRDQLWRQSKARGTGFKERWMGYPTDFTKGPPPPPSEPPSPSPLPPPVKVLASVCSDVHLGTVHSRCNEFSNWLKKIDKGSIILLGDILDLWVYSEVQGDAALVKHVAAAWSDLWDQLKAARDRGCNVHFIPGNHDVFALFLELADIDPWSESIVRKTPILSALRDATKGKRLLEVADLHYPCMRLQTGGSTIVMTHGHFETWYWRLMTGLGDSNVAIPTALCGISVVLAHKHARLLRRIVIETDWLRRMRRMEDTTISITNALLVAYDGALDMIQNNAQDDLVALIDRALALYFGTSSQITPSEELKIRESLLHMHLHRGDPVNELHQVRDEHIKFFRSPKSGTNIEVHMQGTKMITSSTELREFATFDTFLFGHFHAPRGVGDVFDSGGFVDEVITSLTIKSDGTVDR